MPHAPAIIVGAGPAGLAAAHELTRRGVRPLVLERLHTVGGIARTEAYRGFRFDIGGHRFYTRSEEIRRLWNETLNGDLLTVRRLSRIHYRGRLFSYPLRARDTLRNLGLGESLRCLASYARARLRPHRRQRTFEQWVINRFGERLYRMFFQTYTEKVWGIPCSRIRAEWAVQRIGSLSLGAAVRNALFGTDGARSLIGEFHYPVLGPGMMWERLAEKVAAAGGTVSHEAEVVRLSRRGDRIESATVRRGGSFEEVAGESFISSMALPELIGRLWPPPPEAVLAAADGLRYRAFVLVALIVDRAGLFPDNWLYIHSPEVRVGRIQNFGNWSAAMVPDSARSCLGMEYFCDEGDALWSMPAAALMDLAARELEVLGLARRGEVADGTVVRQPGAYPVYDDGYRTRLRLVRGFLATVRNLQTVGRNGMHRYNNQDHSMLTGMLAARNLVGERHDVWRVNADHAYGEAAPQPEAPAAGGA